MAATWEFIGEFRPHLFPGRDRDLGACAGLNFSGWARKASHGESLSSRDWRIRSDEAELPLVVDDCEEDFLTLCCTAGLECWTTGQLLVVRGEQLLLPELFTVFSTRGCVPTVPVRAAARIAETAMRRALSDLWQPRDAGDLPAIGVCGSGPSALHPLAHPAAAAYLQALDDPRQIAALLFASHAEATTLSRSSLFHGQDAARLGSSRFYYSRDDDAVRVTPPAVTCVGEVLRGCLIVGADPRALLQVARAFLELSPSWGGDDGTLVVSTREDLPFVASSLRGLDFALATSAADLQAPKGVVVTSCELLLDELDRDPVLLSRRWGRLVSVGWPRACEASAACGVLVDFVFHLALAVYEDVYADGGEGVNYGSLAQLLGVSASGLNDPAATRAALEQRVMHLEERRSLRSAPKPSFACSVLSIEAPDSLEDAALRPFRPANRRKRAALGALCGRPRQSFRPLAAGSSVLDHFARQQPTLHLDAFASANLGGARAEGCPVCFEPDAPVATRCGHWFCEACLELSFSVQARCPTCRRALHRVRDVVHTRPVERSPATPFMRGLLASLASAQERSLVVCSYGDLHERLAAHLRAEGAPETWAWRGNTKQLVRTLRRFEASARGCLIVDPEGPCLSWATWPAVRSVFVLWPLEDSEACCQLRSVLRALPPTAPAPDVVLFAQHGTEQPELTRCQHGEHWWCDFKYSRTT